MPKLVPIDYKKLVRIFELDGAIVIGQRGSHVVLRKPKAKRRLVIPTYKHTPVFIIINNLRTANMSREQYFELLNKVK